MSDADALLGPFECGFELPAVDSNYFLVRILLPRFGRANP